jgi:hypothetical protein
MADIATIERHRGDTFANDMTITKADGTPLNLTGYTVVLTVSRQREPADVTPQLFQITGTIFNAAGGQVRFQPSAPQADQAPGTYYYDVQLTDGAGAVKTLGPGKYIFKQDITK